MKTIRLDRLLANLAYGSRSEVGKAVRAGAFTLNGNPITDPGAAIPLDAVREGKAEFDGEKLDPIHPLTVLLHKPRGYTCSHDEQGLLIYDLLPERWRYRDPALASAGRLDKDSSGMVILTDDGTLLHRIISPKTHVLKHYRVTLRDKVRGDETPRFMSGTYLMRGDTKPLKPALWQPDTDTSGVMSLQEGRYHQIRRMFETEGNEVVTLHRYRVGDLDLGDLAEGEYRLLNEDDISKLFPHG
jgi:16S rRNA pseudouridine516 synthase